MGPAVEFTPVSVTEEWVDRWWNEVGSTTPNKVHRFQRGGEASVTLELEERRALDLPDRLPAMKQQGVHCGPGGRGWVERNVEADAPPRIDVFDQTGTRVQRFDLPMGARIVGFGDGAVFVVLRDAFDLEYVARLDVPPSS
jgi:hypothetical protein